MGIRTTFGGRTLGLIAALGTLLAAQSYAFSPGQKQHASEVSPKKEPPQKISGSKDVVPPDPKPKKPWLGAASTAAGNITVWLADRYVFNRSYSRISWKSIKANFSEGFIWDSDSFSMSFLGHPYHGGQYFSGARGLGLNFWESLPYSAGGYLMWGFFLESDRASYNDLIMTTLGGANLGELGWRLTEQVLDDSATGGNRALREIAAFIISPSRGVGRLIGGAMFRRRESVHHQHEPFHGSLTFAGRLISDSAGFHQVHFGPAVTFDMTYGLDARGLQDGHPFDLIFLTCEAGYTRDRARLQLSTYGPWFGRAWGGAEGPQHFLGLFQNYDFLDSEAFQLGGTSTTVGLISQFRLGPRLELRTSIQAGGILLAGTKNPYLRTGERTYNYGGGGVGKLEAWLVHETLGIVSLRLSHFRVFAYGGTAPLEADESHDVLTLVIVRYTLPVSGNLGLSLDYGRYVRRQRLEGHPDSPGDLSRLGAALEYRF